MSSENLPNASYGFQEQSNTTVQERLSDHELEQAAATLDAIEEHVKEADPNATPEDVDEMVAGYVDDADATNDETAESEAAGVGVVEMEKNPRAWHTALAFMKLPINKIAAVLRKLKPADADRVTAIVDQAEHDQPADTFEPSINREDKGGIIDDARVEGLDEVLGDSQVEGDVPSAERVKLDAILNDLRSQREVVANSNVTVVEYLSKDFHARKDLPQPLLEKVDRSLLRDAEGRFADDDTNAEGLIKLMGEIYLLEYQDQTSPIGADYFSSDLRWASLSKQDTQKAQAVADLALVRIMTNASSANISKMRILPKDKQGNLEFMMGRAIEASKALPRYDKLLLQAKLSGYDSVTQNFKAIQSGEASSSEVTRLDTIAEIDPASTEDEMKDVGFECLMDIGIGPELASEMMVAMHGRASVPIDTASRKLKIDPMAMQKELGLIDKAVSRIGIEKMVALRQKCGIVNVGELSESQLDRMSRFVEGDPSLIEELASKEVCVMLRDATHDWNGAYRGVNTAYETNQGATLIFEISSMKGNGAQIDGYRAQLEMFGVRPSVLVLAGHGSPGAMRMGDGALGVRPPKIDVPYALIGDSAVADIMATMKPDRDGNCTIIYKSCSQAGAMAHEDDSTLTRTGEVIRDRTPGQTYQLYGTKKSSNIRTDYSGALYDRHAGQNITRVIVGESGNIYSHDTDIRPELPMFKKIAEPIDTNSII